MLTAWIAIGVLGVLALIALRDLTQKRHAITRNFPIIGRLRYLLETIGPELRQYIVTDNNEERPFSRDQRRWVYASSKQQNNYFGFGTDRDLELSPHNLVIKHSVLPAPESSDDHDDVLFETPCAKVLGGARQRAKAFRPRSVINISAMSYGSLSAAAIEAINRGCRVAGSMHNTGEGGVSAHHLHGGNLIMQVGTGYFGCRDEDGKFDLNRLIDCIGDNPVKAIEIKLSQGAKPGLGGVLPAAKITPEIARIRGIPMGKDCISPSYHTAFGDADSMLDFVERVADATGLPVGIKSAVGDLTFWYELASLMGGTDRGVDFVTLDGGEGGTGAAPLAFSDHVSLPFKIGMTRVYRVFAERGLQEDIVFVGSGRLGFPVQALFAMALGCDMVHVAREAMMSIGCIQAQRCHTGHCPAGVATQSNWLMHGLDPTLKSARLANYVITLRKDLRRLARACGSNHPALVPLDRFEVIDEKFGSRLAADVFGYDAGWGVPSESQRAAVHQLTVERHPVG